MLKRVFVLCLLVFAFGFQIFANESELKVQRAEAARHFCVRVLSTTAGVFNPVIEGGHGTGFIISIDQEEGLVFTNRHVVEKNAFELQSVELEFKSDDGKTQEVDGEIVYVSEVYDFAVVRFNPKNLKPALRKIIQTASLAKIDEFAELSKQGRSVMVYGFPNEGSHISTFGSITGLSAELFNSKSAIQTDAAINPGNSGGPMIDLDTGKVIGMNTAIDEQGQNIGYAIPLSALLKDYFQFLESPTSISRKLFPFSSRELSEDVLQALELSELVEKHAPGYLERFNSVIAVVAAPEKSGLEAGDLIISVEGKVIGPELDQLDWEARIKKGSHLEMGVIRQAKFHEVQVPVLKLQDEKLKAENDFLMFGGILFQELSNTESELSNHGEAGVKILDVTSGSMAEQADSIVPGAYLKEVHAKGKKHIVKNLAALKKFMASLQPGEILTLVIRPILLSETGPVTIPALEGRLIHLQTLALEHLPFDELISPENFDLEKMRAQFDFSGLNAKKNNWRSYLKSGCAAHMKKLRPKQNAS